MKRKLHHKIENNSTLNIDDTVYNNDNTFLEAIEQVEHFVTSLNPQNYRDIKNATKCISQASIGAYLSVHSISETLDFINQIAHSMVEDISEAINLPQDYKPTLH